MVAKWGNPETKSFERVNLRWARYGDLTVQVHKHIWPMVERILVGLDGQGIDVSSIEEHADPRRLGFRLAGADQAIVNDLIEAAKFAYDGVSVTFVGDAEEAVAIAAQLAESTEAEAEEPEPIPVETERAAVAPPFAFDLEDGPLALFVQYLTGATATGVVDAETTARLTEWQRRMLIEETGVLDARTWSYIVPRRVTWMRPGATGHQVKVIQAAFKAHGYYEPSVNGVWGIEMSRSLRRFQHDYGIHSRLRIGNPEWAALFGEKRELGQAS